MGTLADYVRCFGAVNHVFTFLLHVPDSKHWSARRLFLVGHMVGRTSIFGRPFWSAFGPICTRYVPIADVGKASAGGRQDVQRTPRGRRKDVGRTSKRRGQDVQCRLIFDVHPTFSGPFADRQYCLKNLLSFSWSVNWLLFIQSWIQSWIQFWIQSSGNFPFYFRYTSDILPVCFDNYSNSVTIVTHK